MIKVWYGKYILSRHPSLDQKRSILHFFSSPSLSIPSPLFQRHKKNNSESFILSPKYHTENISVKDEFVAKWSIHGAYEIWLLVTVALNSHNKFDSSNLRLLSLFLLGQEQLLYYSYIIEL